MSTRQHYCSPLTAPSFSAVSLQAGILTTTQKLMTTNSIPSSQTPPLSLLFYQDIPQLPQIHYFKTQIPVHTHTPKFLLRSSSCFLYLGERKHILVSCRFKKPKWFFLFYFLLLSSPLNNSVLKPLSGARQVRCMCGRWWQSSRGVSPSRGRRASQYVGEGGRKQPDYEQGEEWSIQQRDPAGQRQSRMRRSTWVGVSNVSRVRKASTWQDGVRAQMGYHGCGGHSGALLRYPFNRTCYEEQSCLTAPSYLTLESTVTFTPGHASSRLLPAEAWAWWECSNSQLWMGLPAHQILSWHLLLWGPELTQKVFTYWCQKHLGWNKTVLEDTTKWLTSLNKGHFTPEYLKNISYYIKKSSGLAEEKFSTGYLSWKGSF